MTIKTRFVLIPTIISALVILIVGFFISIQYDKTLMQNLNNSQNVVVKKISKSVEDYIYKYHDVLVLLESTDIVKDTSMFDDISVAYRGVPDDVGIEIRTLFKDTLAIYPEFAYLETFTKDNALNVILEPYSAQLNISEASYLQGFSYRDWYKGAMSQMGTYVSEAYVSASIMKPVIAISTPIFDKDEIVGIMIGAVELSKLSEMVKTLGDDDTSITYIFDKNGYLVAHPLKSIITEDELVNISESNIGQLILNASNNSDETIRLFDDISGEDVFVNYNKIPGHEWYVVTQVSVTQALKSKNQLIYLISIFTFFILFGYIYFHYKTSDQMVKPILLLTLISKKLVSKNLKLDIDDVNALEKIANRTDELGTLASSYLTMINTQNENFTQLINTQIELTNKIDEINEQKNHIQFLASHDPLTSLPNRRELNKILLHILIEDGHGAVLLFDLDNFKAVNDTMGHIFGDQLLIAVSKKLNSFSNEHATVFRFGGDEFIIVLTEINQNHEITTFIEKIKFAFGMPVSVGESNIDVKFSIGISVFPKDSKEISSLIMYSDLALYSAKKHGKNTYKFFDNSMNLILKEHTEIKTEISNALINDGFKLVYQPQVDLKTGDIIGYEALLRFKNNKFSPSSFIKIAEENGQIIEIGRWVVREAIQQIAEWKRLKFEAIPVSINFSALQLRDVDFIRILKETLSEYEVDSYLLVLEVTETIFIEIDKTTIAFIDELYAMGISLAMDDFGTGFSSLNYVADLPISRIKLDKTMIDRFVNSENIAIVESIITLSHFFDLQVIAEGVEDYATMKLLADIGCNSIQGYYFSKPIEAHEVPLLGINLKEKL